MSRTSRASELHLLQRSRQTFGSGLHQWAVRRHAHRQLDRALRALRLRDFDRAVDGGGGARDHDLAGRVEVRGLYDFALRGFTAGSFDFGVVDAEDRSHRALPRRHCCLHRLAAKLHEPDSRPEIERTGAHERGVLAEAVAGHCRRQAAAVLAPDAPRGDAGREHRGLRALGLAELVLGAALAQLPEVVTEHVGGLRERFLHERLGAGERGEHADGLRALTGKNECERHERAG